MSNSFGTFFRITTFGESHGPCVGVVVDGCPSGIELTEADIDKELAKRRPGNSPYTSPRKEEDRPRIVSGVFEGKTTGMPITILIDNGDANPEQYASLQNVYRPGHANYTYLKKYGVFDHRGGGRSSGRETAARVAAAAIAKKITAPLGIRSLAYVSQIGHLQAIVDQSLDLETIETLRDQSPVYCPDPHMSKQMEELLLGVKRSGDSVGAVVTCLADLPLGLGEPLFEKIEAKLASAMLSIPATKGFEIGEGFKSATMRGSQHNDSLSSKGFITNHAGGSLGGISTGERLILRVAFKPTSSIKIPQQSVTLQGEETTIRLPEGARHDPCIGIRAAIVVEAMAYLVCADLQLAPAFNKYIFTN